MFEDENRTPTRHPTYVIPRSLAPVTIPLAIAGLAVGCASVPALPPLALDDARTTASSLAVDSPLDAPYRLEFEWSSDEPGARFNGRGVARVEPPDRARLDLFLSNGERAAVAAMVGDDLRVLAGARTELPPAPLLWGALGVFRPGASNGLAGGRGSAAGPAELVYTPARGPGPAAEREPQIVYQVRDARMVGIDVRRSGRTVEELRIGAPEGSRFPSTAVYRDHEDVRVLRITLESVEASTPFPMEIWTPAP